MISNQSNSFNDAYYNILIKLAKSPDVIRNIKSYDRSFSEYPQYTFCIDNPSNNTTKSIRRGFKKEFAQKFFEWIWDGGKDASIFLPLNDNAKKFVDDVDGRNTAYGPRIKEQIKFVIEEIFRDKETRRAVVMILYPSDIEILEKKANKETKMEFPCTISFQFMIRENELNMHVFMRSNNALTTLCYDVYNFTNIQMKMVEILKEKYKTLKIGKYFHTSASMHLYDDEKKLAFDIIDEYKEKGL